MPKTMSLRFSSKRRGTINEPGRITSVVVVFVFNVPPTAKVIWRRVHGLSLIRQTGEAGDRNCDPWFTRQVVYPLHHSGSYNQCYDRITAVI